MSWEKITVPRSEPDPALWNAHPGVSMSAWLVLERLYCTCNDHPQLRDPECAFCEIEEAA